MLIEIDINVLYWIGIAIMCISVIGVSITSNNMIKTSALIVGILGVMWVITITKYIWLMR